MFRADPRLGVGVGVVGDDLPERLVAQVDPGDPEVQGLPGGYLPDPNQPGGTPDAPCATQVVPPHSILLAGLTLRRQGAGEVMALALRLCSPSWHSGF